MSIDSTRLQDLTPYLHAIWYSFYQIILAMYFLWLQMGPSCMAGIAVIILTIPLTGKLSAYQKKLQKEMSRVRDSRVQATNEVLSGMKVIKIQAWEGEFDKKINMIRTKELSLLRRYFFVQSCSGALYLTIPLLVALSSFATYIGTGHQLDVATALTCLALFDILRFPLFMLPNVLNNLIEAKVSVERVQSFLLEGEKKPVSNQVPVSAGAVMDTATLLWERVRKQAKAPVAESIASSQSYFGRFKVFFLNCFANIKVLFELCCEALQSMENEVESFNVDGEVASPFYDETDGEATCDVNGPEVLEYDTLPCAAEPLSVEHMDDHQYAAAVSDAQLAEAEGRIAELESLLLGRDYSAGRAEATEPAARLLALSRVSFSAGPGQLVAIVGQVGSGKSSLLSGLLGDLHVCRGSVARRGRLAFVGQRPFIQNSTLKDNILFGLPYDVDRYEDTLERCALLPDLAVLPAGDQTEIGERGINLSGGQKARVALARAVYSDPELLLLDDPLAAVDSHVGLHLFERCILPLQARNKCILLVTNALQFTKHCSLILVVRNGRVVESGQYAELLSAGLWFSDMAAAHEESRGTAESEDSGSALPEAAFTSPTATVLSIPSLKVLVKKTAAGAVSIPVSSEGIEMQRVDAAGRFDKAAAGRLIAAEDREIGGVDRRVYYQWMAAAGGGCVCCFMFSLFVLSEALSVLSSVWLSYWSQHRDHGSPWFYLGVYAGINFLMMMFSLFRELYCRIVSLQASKVLFERLVGGVLYSPMCFFDTTPLGRIVNRFSKDVYTVDEQIPQSSRSYLASMTRVLSVLLYISVITPLFILALVPIAVFYAISQNYYIRTSRELSRLDSTSRSPIYALFSETLDGISTIRAFKSVQRFAARNNRMLDENQKAYFLNFSANCWLAVRLEFAGALIVTLAALTAVYARNTMVSHKGFTINSVEQSAFAGMAGLGVSLALSVTQSLNWTVRTASDLESQMVSVERVEEYSSMAQEAPHYTPLDPPTYWPTKGVLEIKNVSMRYRPGLPLVLNNISLNIEAREKIGVVGRTGAGKSSLLTVLLRLVELESGSVWLDGVDLASIGLHALRSRVAVIAQDPMLFSGTIRSNLDPFKAYSDMALWESLRRTTLAKNVTSLDDTVAENGSNFSVGQRQLLCIARALLSRASVIIMDEATAAVDVETDAAIQRSIREEFAAATCITVAHRINTIMDCDKILVMDAGRVAEYDTPANLLSLSRATPSMFASLVANWDKH